MNNEKFLKDINRDLIQGKEELKSRNESIIKELNDYQTMLDDELQREKSLDSKKAINPLFNNPEGNEIFDELIKRDQDNGAMLDFDEMDEEGYDIIVSLAANDPMFALNFIERRRTEIPEEKYENMKKEILSKLNLN